MPKRKRKAFVDRAIIIENQGIQQAVVEGTNKHISMFLLSSIELSSLSLMPLLVYVTGVKAESICTKMNSPERVFTHKLMVYKQAPIADGTSSDSKSSSSCSMIMDENYCPVYVMYNEMCVLMAPACLSKEVQTITYDEKILKAGERIHGKRKKGAYSLHQGGIIAVLTYIDGTEHTLKTPVGGCVFEINENIMACPQLINRKRVGEGYIAVIYPRTKLPQLQS